MHSLFAILFLINHQFVLLQGDLKPADYSVVFNQEISTIQLQSNLTHEVVNNEFSIVFFEIEIFDVNDEYTGSLELKSLVLPASEIEVFERMRISKAILQHTSGKKLTLENKQIQRK